MLYPTQWAEAMCMADTVQWVKKMMEKIKASGIETFYFSSPWTEKNQTNENKQNKTKKNQ